MIVDKRATSEGWTELSTTIRLALYSFQDALRWEWLVWAILLAALALRLFLGLTHDGYLGVDGGAYLLSQNAVLGDEPTGAGFPRPPLAPGWLLVPFTAAYGNDIGYKLWSILASLAPVLPVYLMGREFIGRIGAVLAVGFLLVDPNHAEMIVTGALPLIAFALLGMAFWGIATMMTRSRWWQIPIVAICVGLIPWVNQTTAGLAVILIPVYTLALFWAHHQLSWRVLLSLGLALPLALGALPWYMAVLPGSGLLDYPGPWLMLSGAADTSWWQMAGAGVLGWVLFRSRPLAPIKALGMVLLVLGGLLVFMSSDETVMNVFYRSRYLIGIPGVVIISWLIYNRWPGHRPVGLALAAGVIVLLIPLYIWTFQRQAYYSDTITPDSAALLEIVTDTPDGIITNSFTMSLWVAALHRVPSPHTWTWTPPPAYQETDRQVRCLLGWVPGCDDVQAKNALGVGWLLVDSRFPYYNSRAPGVYGALNKANPWENLAQVPWLCLVQSQGKSSLWQVRKNCV